MVKDSIVQSAPNYPRPSHFSHHQNNNTILYPEKPANLPVNLASSRFSSRMLLDPPEADSQDAKFLESGRTLGGG